MQNNFLEKFIPNDMPKLYAQDGQFDNATVYLKLEAINGWVWYLTEFDGNNTFFGFVHGWADEWGYVSMYELNESYSKGLIWVCEDFKPVQLKNAITEKVG
jgi:hypothetical protein